MRLKNIVIVVNDIEKSKKFYKEVFGLMVISDFGCNVVMTEGLVLQDKLVWCNDINGDIVMPNNSVVLYFEESNLDEFIEKLKQSEWDIKFIRNIFIGPNGQRVIRIYDVDNHIIEIGEIKWNHQ